MINIYENIRDQSRNIVSGRTKLFIEDTDADGNIINFLHGTSVVPDTSGSLFIVDDWLIPQIEKLLFIDGTLQVKDGEELDVPVKTEKELMIEELQRQMAELQAMPDEPDEPAAE